MKLADTQHAILIAAALHPDHVATAPERPPAGARQYVAQALLKYDLVISVHRSGYDAQALWLMAGRRAAEDHRRGLRAIGTPEDGEKSAFA